MRTFFRIAALSLSGLIACSACSSDDPMTSAELWSGVGASTAFSDEPETLGEIVDQAAFVVKAKVSRIYKGPDTVYTQPEGEIRQPSLLLDLVITDVLEGAPPDNVTVHFTMITGDLRATEHPPQDEYLWFLEPSGEADYFMTTSFSGVVVDLDGEITTPRDPGSAVLDATWESLEDVQNAVEELVG